MDARLARGGASAEPPPSKRLMFASLLLALGSVVVPQDRPDILIILLDDVGSRDIARISTPNIDLLGERGVRFHRGYAHA